MAKFCVRNLQILRTIFVNSAQILCTFSSGSLSYLVCSFVLCAFMSFSNFLVLFYFMTFTSKCFALAVAAISAELRAILLYKICKILHILCCFVNSAHNGQNSAYAESQHSDIPNYDVWLMNMKNKLLSEPIKAALIRET